MSDLVAPYGSALLALGLYGGLYVVQLLVADVVGILRKHTPGTAVIGEHDDFLFRSARAHANTTESIGAVILIAVFAMAAGGDPAWVNGAAWALLGLRTLHTLAYYADLRTVRSIAFGAGMIALISLLGTGLRAL